MCDRPLILPTVAIPTRAGPMAYGPVCAKRAGLVRPKERTPKSERALTSRKVSVVQSVGQSDWIEQAQEGTQSARGAVFSVEVVHG